ncbi:MAG: S41 family peptidase, partial [Bacteroidales bacterium]|nr:S41 family peptidase [Bacteroidales bacterium]
NYIEEEYVDTVNKNDLVEMAISEILKQLDPHSVYIPASELKELNEPLEGNFEGIGVQFNMPDDTVVVIAVISGGPSEKIGILPGDRIIYIEDSLVAGVKMKNTDIVKMLKGPKGTKVEVSIMRKGISELINFEITRDKIPLYSIDIAYMIKDDIGYIKISQFAKTTYQEFTDAIAKLNQQGMQKLVLDLRGNGGGFMDAATNIANEFLEANKLIVYTKGKSRPKRETLSNSKGNCLDKKVVVLVDEWSASASEILAGALQDNDRGTIVGRRSFGKGLVQQQTMFNDGSALRLTIARYYTPTGRSIQKPYVNGDEQYYDDLSERFNHGEFVEKDSIKLNDSLKFYTPKGKIVYGGGGIMPDIFVPYDTSGQTNYYMQVLQKGLIYRFAFDYADNNREKLAKYKNYKELEKYLDKQKLLDKFIKYAEEKGINKNPNELKASKELIYTQLKASVSRNLLDNEGFYPIISKIDVTLQKAVEIIEK